MDTKITQEPLIASQIIKHVLGQNPQGGVTINVVTIGTLQVGSHSQDNSSPPEVAAPRLRLGNSAVRYQDFPKEEFIEVLRSCDWNAVTASKKMGIPVATIRNRARKFGGMRQLKGG